jgi:tetratricopeptide (TPR) repeat protein
MDLAEKYYVIAVNNRDYNCIANLSKIYEKSKNYDLSIKYYKLAIENGYSPAIKYLSDIYIECGKIEEAFDLYNKHSTNF